MRSAVGDHLGLAKRQAAFARGDADELREQGASERRGSLKTLSRTLHSPHARLERGHEPRRTLRLGVRLGDDPARQLGDRPLRRAEGLPRAHARGARGRHVGNTLGSLTTYGLGPADAGAQGARARALAWVRRYGAWTLLLAWLPVSAMPLCAAAGWLRIAWWRATLAMALGKLAALSRGRTGRGAPLGRDFCCTAVKLAPAAVLPVPAKAPELPMTRLREIPYNYTSFSDREIVIRLLGEDAWQRARRSCATSAHGPLGADALRSAGRHLGRAAQSLPAGRPARQSAAPGAAGRGDAPPPRGGRAAPPRGRLRRRTQPQGGAAARGGERRGRRVRARVRRDARACAGARCASSPPSRARTTSPSTAWRASRT